MEENTQIENNDSVKTVDEAVSIDPRDTEIAELKETIKNKSIEARLAKKDSKPEADSNLLERVTRMELKENGLTDADELELVLKEAKDLNVDPIALVKRGLADGLLERHRKAKADELANVGTSSRANANSRDTVEYWIAKGEYPTDNVELKRKIVKAKGAQSNQTKMFNY
jgi:hypothetical protein